jgi:uncharacterized membrane protein YgcG
MADFQNQRKKIALDESKLKLTGPQIDGGRGRPTLAVGLHNNQPRLDVYTNDPNDKIDNGRIRAAFDSPTFFVFLESLREVVEHDGKVIRAIQNRGYSFRGGKRSEQPETLSTALVGKEDDGRVYLEVVAERRPRIKFYFMPSNWHHLMDGQGNKLEQAQVSVLYARAWLNLMQRLIPNLLCSEYTEPPPRDNNGGNRGGNRGGDWNNRGGNRGGNQGGGDGGDSWNSGSRGAPAGAGDDEFPF